MAEVNFVDGQALTATSFGTFDANGYWIPQAYTGTYGTNGFYLDFKDSANIGNDASTGGTNDWTSTNFNVTTTGATYDWMIDVPTMYNDGAYGRGNYAVWSKADTNSSGTTIWNAGISNNDAGTDVQLRSTIAVSSGKWYYEWTFQSAGAAAAYSHMGVATSDSALIANYLGSTSTSWSIWVSNGNKRNNASSVAYGSGVTANDVIMCAFDVDAGKIWWGKNGTWFATGDPAAGTNAAFTNLTGTIAASCTPRDISHVNFGQRPFSYTPPTGYKALNTYNVTEVTTDLEKPDLVWIKSRSAAGSHYLFDSVRGVTKSVSTDSTAAEATDVNSLQLFDKNGFQLGSSSNVNTSGTTYAAWAWKANGSTTVTNTSGTITSQVSAGVSQGFSIVTYTGNGTAGATVGHGLGVAPKMVIVKPRNQTNNWMVYSSELGATKYLGLDSTTAATALLTAWNNTAPTSSTFSLGSSNGTNQNTATFVAYCFSEVDGYSKFGSYTNNASSDGPFVYLGFRPAFVMIKYTTAGASDWMIFDTARDTYNASQSYLRANSTAIEATKTWIDFLSNGFKVRNTDGTTASLNFTTGTGTFIFAAFAESPFKYSLAR
jgi:hypothetical protein